MKTYLIPGWVLGSCLVLDEEKGKDALASQIAMEVLSSGRPMSSFSLVREQEKEPLFLEASRLVEKYRDRSQKDNSVRLTKREVEVLKLLFRGDSNKEIANRVGLTERTVKYHVSSLLLKFGLPTRVRLIKWLLENPLMRESFGLVCEEEKKGILS
jgi:two-component system nitrate/nitrite response regulator NarL